jgi:hypothetical protein
MKYSLRSLMIVVTLACVLLGGRIEYLRRWAVFHEQEAVRRAPVPPAPGTIVPDIEWLGVPEEDSDPVGYHKRLALYYRTAMFRPWQFGAPPTDDKSGLKHTSVDDL